MLFLTMVLIRNKWHMALINSSSEAISARGQTSIRDLSSVIDAFRMILQLSFYKSDLFLFQVNIGRHIDNVESYEYFLIFVFLFFLLDRCFENSTQSSVLYFNVIWIKQYDCTNPLKMSTSSLRYKSSYRNRTPVG